MAFYSESYRAAVAIGSCHESYKGTSFGAPPQILMKIGTPILEVFVSRKVKTASAQIK